jgi:hypothetical protein
VLTLVPRVVPRRTQRELATERFRPADGDFSLAAGLPAPGVLARHNAVGTPGLLPDGTPSDLSLSRVLLARESLAEAAAAAGGTAGEVPAEEAPVQARVEAGVAGPDERPVDVSSRPGGGAEA